MRMPLGDLKWCVGLVVLTAFGFALSRTLLPQTRQGDGPATHWPPYSVNGIELGMSWQEIERQLGPPLRGSTKLSCIYQYGAHEKVEVYYFLDGRCSALTGERLEQDGREVFRRGTEPESVMRLMGRPWAAIDEAGRVMEFNFDDATLIVHVDRDKRVCAVEMRGGWNH